uniref:CARD domain-containing protein n=1 Tax=Neogobius melanostomus TaxID=47308 RepID=A0A8C6TIG3_9GOBI
IVGGGAGPGLDRLLQSGVLTGAERESAASIRERRTRATQLIDSVLKKGSKASRVFIQDLHDQDLLLFDELLRI